MRNEFDLKPWVQKNIEISQKHARKISQAWMTWMHPDYSLLWSDNDEIDWAEDAGMTGDAGFELNASGEDEYGVNCSTTSPASDDKDTVIEEPHHTNSTSHGTDSAKRIWLHQMSTDTR